jgi:hypothetical protein
MKVLESLYCITGVTKKRIASSMRLKLVTCGLAQDTVTNVRALRRKYFI